MCGNGKGTAGQEGKAEMGQKPRLSQDGKRVLENRQVSDESFLLTAAAPHSDTGRKGRAIMSFVHVLSESTVSIEEIVVLHVEEEN